MIELRVAGDRSLVDAEDAEAAHEGIDHNLENVGKDVALGSGTRLDLFRILALALEE